METKQDTSVGIVPVYIAADGAQSFCLVHHTVVPDGSGGHWAFPKGHIDAGESKEGAARRELYEETGILTCKIDMDYMFIERYSFQKDDVRFDKDVTYFVGCVGDKPAVAPIDAFRGEISEARWLSYEEAKELLTFPESKNILDDVLVYLDSNKHPFQASIL